MKGIRPLTGPQVLLRLIFIKLGGTHNLTLRMRHETGNKKFISQLFRNWWKNGRVPMKHALLLSKLTGVSVFALNYRDACYATATEPTWDFVVNSLNLLTAREKKNVLRYRGPKWKSRTK